MLEQELAGRPGDALEVALSVAGEPCVPRLGAGCKLGGTFLVLGAGNQHGNLSLWRGMEADVRLAVKEACVGGDTAGGGHWGQR